MNNSVELLFSRLVWPSGLVREKACAAIAELLNHPETEEQIYSYLLDWMVNQELESIAFYGLLIIWKAKSLNSKLSIPEDISSKLSRPSILSDILLKELGLKPNVSLKNYYSNCKNYIPNRHKDFFENNKGVFPPYYLADEIYEKYGIDFNSHWMYEWSARIQELNLKLSKKAFNFWGRQDSEHYISYDIAHSDVFRSTFMRTLAWAVSEVGLNYSYAHYLSLRCSPLNLDLWSTNPGEKPVYWPFMEGKVDGVDTIPSVIINKINNLWHSQSNKDKCLLQAGGIVYSSPELVYHLEIVAGLQKTIGNGKPNIELIFESLHSGTKQGYGNLNFEGNLPIEPIEGFKSGDWILIPICERVIPKTIPSWQPWRIGNIFLPLGGLFEKNTKYFCSKDSIKIAQNNEIIGEWKDWLYRFKEKTISDLPLNSGQELYLKKELLNEILSELKFNYCWFCKITSFFKENSYSDFKKTQFYHQIGGTSIITP